MQVGKFVGRFVAQSFGFNDNSKNRYVQIAFQLLGGKVDGEVVKLTKALTENTAEQLRSTYLACGWDGKAAVNMLDARRLSKLVAIDVESATFEIDGQKKTGFQVAFVNALTRVRNELPAEEAAKFSADLISWGGGKAANPTTADGDIEFDPDTGEVIETKPVTQAAAATS